MAQRTIEYTVEQRGLVPAPGGPRGSGKMLNRGRVGLEGGVTGSPVFRSEESRFQAESGDVVANSAAFGRVVIAAGDQLEIGINGEYAREELATQVSSDREEPRLAQRYLLRGGPSLRWLFNRGDLQFGGLAELEVGRLPYSRTVYERSFLTTGNGDREENWWESDELRTVYLGETVSSKRTTESFTWGRIGLFLTGPVGEGTNIGFGMMLQNRPRFFGVKTLVEQCDVYASGNSICSGEEPSDIDPVESRGVTTAFLWLSEDLSDQLTLIAQLYGHVAGDNGGTPFGGAFSLRYAFGEPRRARRQVRPMPGASE